MFVKNIREEIQLKMENPSTRLLLMFLGVVSICSDCLFDLK